MKYMFINCISLTSLNLSTFNTSQVTNMNSMLYNCKSLVSLNLSNFNTEKLTDISYLFYGYSQLKFVDISNFNLSKISSLSSVFKECQDLAYINFVNFSIKEGNSFSSDFFQSVPDNIMNWISNEEYIQVIQNGLYGKKCPMSDCSDDSPLNKQYYIKLSDISDKCMDSWWILSNYL